MKIAVTTSVLVASIAIAPGAPAQVNPTPDYVIIPAERQWAKSGLLPHWTPSESQAREAMMFLDAYAAREKGARLQSLESYRFQVLGVTASAGNNLPGLQAEAASLVVLQGVCSRAPPDLQKRLGAEEVVIMDGGNCYFRAYIDLEKHRMAWLSINGFA